MPLYKNVSVDLTEQDIRTDIRTGTQKEEKYRWINDHGLLLFARDDIVKQYWPGICRSTIRKIVEKFCSVVYNGPRGAGVPLAFLDLKGLESLRKGYAPDKENGLNLRYLVYTCRKFIREFTPGDTMNLDLEWLQSAEYDPLTNQLIHPKIPREEQKESCYKQPQQQPSTKVPGSPLPASPTRTSNAMAIYRDRSEAVGLVEKSFNAILIKFFPSVAVGLLSRLMNGDFANIGEFAVECSKISDTHKDTLVSFGVQQIISQTEQFRIEANAKTQKLRIETESKNDKLRIILETTGKTEQFRIISDAKNEKLRIETHACTEQLRFEAETKQVQIRSDTDRMAIEAKLPKSQPFTENAAPSVAPESSASPPRVPEDRKRGR